MDALEAGEDFIITRNGRPVGNLRPVESARELTTMEIKRRISGKYALAGSGQQERAQIDAAFGQDRLDDE
jgi:antitoxin (DNA-binding transcriptional repressor) of toxin-antitoxin stability system